MGFLRWPWARHDPEGQPPSGASSNAPDSHFRVKLTERDAASLDTLLGAGADLAEPRQVLYFMYFPSDEDAEQAAASARKWGFAAEVGSAPAPLSSEWSVVCEKRGLVLEPETVRQNSERFEALAAAHHGDFDGWEASI